MLTRQRHQLILDRLRLEGQIVATALSEELSLSEDTIRRDLRALASEGLLQRVHGGALPTSAALGSYAVRRNLELAGKQTIGKAAAAMVRPGQVVFVDGGTTCHQLVLQLPSALKATVVTHSPSIAVALADHLSIEVELIGGHLFKHSVVAMGAAAMQAIGRIQADLYFMGVTGVSVSRGFCTGNLEEAHIKGALLAQSAETWVMASAEKLHATAPYKIASFSEVTGLIVEANTSKKDVAHLARGGLSVITA
jgi:DeoR/GlpR family transcriptional regulator of sugar metabolism